MNKNILKSKQEVVKTITNSFKENSAVIVAEYRGLTVSEISELRRNLAKDGAKMAVYKNSLVSRAASELGYKGLDEYLSGPNVIIFSNDAIKGPKTVSSFAKKHEHLVIKGGFVEGKVISKQDVLTLAKLPGREGLLSMLCSVLQAPIRNFAFAVKSIAEKQN